MNEIKRPHMKKNIIFVIFTSLFLLSACDNNKEQAQIEEAKALIAEANSLLQEAKKQSSAISYEGWLQSCVDKRDEIEASCHQKKDITEQAACLVGASKALGLCMAQNSFENIQDKVITEGAELGGILGKTALELEEWAKSNEGDINSLVEGLAPLLNELSGSASGESNPFMEDFFNLFGKSLKEALEK